MPEVPTPFSCPLCGANASEPTVITRGDGTRSEGWLRCAKCRRYQVSVAPAEPHVPPKVKRYR
ncbi:MAG TPA: hypothetical protein VFK92_02070 [Burkholderiales bacterium]|nr:hypothetical protein [Burkholderiales bacterium]